jgi:hypothetical protein
LRVFIDPGLPQWPDLWAAGTWNDGFGVEPNH